MRCDDGCHSLDRLVRAHLLSPIQCRHSSPVHNQLPVRLSGAIPCEMPATGRREYIWNPTTVYLCRYIRHIRHDGYADRIVLHRPAHSQTESTLTAVPPAPHEHTPLIHDLPPPAPQRPGFQTAVDSWQWCTNQVCKMMDGLGWKERKGRKGRGPASFALPSPFHM